MPIIYHVTTAAEWTAAKANGYYESPSLKAEGFIHCSQDHQVAGVLERYFTGKADLVKLVIDTDKLTSRFVFEWSPSTEDTFPHVYGTINVDVVVDVIEL
ncbi:DUF952 domain-containing protein [Lacibacter luteus]|uniref:DUF952 domain-containing protein n=1 Tax=Lacibacter luteus TaxID=2508719 RepID=A0A4Q1CEQ0_9BACT|nr:DUF952 domain-containing protein [Lacibacter luteus]RXK58354.1 DUF952 domain-containing protein [Lacibacter luteus]